MPDLNAENASTILAQYEQIHAMPFAVQTGGVSALDAFVLNAVPLGLTEEGFDWMNWPPVQSRQIEDLAFIAQADPDTLRKIITAHVRLERYESGHLALMEERGILPAAMERLRMLLAQGELG